MNKGNSSHSMKDCNNIKLELQAYLDNSLLPDKKALVQEHLMTCQECQRSLSRLKQVSKFLLEWKVIEPSPDFLKQVNQKLDTLTLRPTRSAKPIPVQKGFDRLKRYLYPMAAAAVLLLAFGIWFMVRPPKQPPQTTPPIIKTVETDLLGSLEKGTLLVQHKGQSQWLAIEEKGVFKDGDILKTENQPAMLSQTDGTKIHLNRSTILCLTKATEASRGHLLLREGSIYLEVVKGDRPLYVETPVGRIKIIGTSLKVDYREYQIMPRVDLRTYYEIIRSDKEKEIPIAVVAVEQGKAVVEYKGEAQELNTGERAAFSRRTPPIKLSLPFSVDVKDSAPIKKTVNYLFKSMDKFRLQGDLDRQTIMEAVLLSYGDEVVPYLIGLLKNKDKPLGRYIPSYIARIIGRLGNQNVYGKLEPLVKSGNYHPSHRYAAANAMVWINPQQGGKFLLDLFKTKDIATKKLCLFVLSAQKGIGYETNSEFIKILAGIIEKGPGHQLFGTAQTSLAYIGDPSALNLLYDMLKRTESDYHVILAVARSIFFIEGKSAYPQLLPKLYALAEDPDDNVKISALKTIMDIEGPEAETKLMPRVCTIGLDSEDFDVKRGALNAVCYFKGIQSQTIDLFNDIITHASRDACPIFCPVLSIAQIGDAPAVELLAQTAHRLMEQWRETHQQLWYKESATLILKFLQKIRNPKALPAFRELLNEPEPDFVHSAVIALAAIGEEEDISRLNSLLKTMPDEYLRQAIKKTIKSIKARVKN